MIDYRMTEDGIMEVRVAGRITKDEIDAVWRKIHADMPAGGRTRILEVIETLDGIEPAAFWEDLKLGLPMLNRVERAAVVSDRGWINVLTKASGLFVSADVRTFAPTEIEQARAWLKAA